MDSDPPSSINCAVVITGAAPLTARAKATIPADRYIVAADGATDHARRAGLDPDLVVGDFDSISPAGRAWAASNADVIEHDAAKAETDTELAIAAAAARHPTRLLLVAGGGDRLDHTFAAIGALGHRSLDEIGAVEACWGDDRIHVVRPHRPLTLRLDPGTTFSVLATHGACHGVTIGNARWPLDDVELEPLVGVGISNEAVAGPVTVTVTDGTATIIVPGAQP